MIANSGFMTSYDPQHLISMQRIVCLQLELEKAVKNDHAYHWLSLATAVRQTRCVVFLRNKGHCSTLKIVFFIVVTDA